MISYVKLDFNSPVPPPARAVRIETTKEVANLAGHVKLQVCAGRGFSMQGKIEVVISRKVMADKMKVCFLASLFS